MKKVLVIGAEGYLGSRLVEYLDNEGYYCQGIDTGYFRYGVLYHYFPLKPTITADARSITEEFISQFHVVIQLAALSNDPVNGIAALDMYHGTRLFTQKIAETCKKVGVRFIFPSSCSVYGKSTGVVNEESEPNPLTLYSKNKIEIEDDLREIADKNFTPIALRFSTVFGLSPRLRFDLVINMLCGMAVTNGKIILNSDGQAWRPHINIEDVCQAFARCIDWDCSYGRLIILNVGMNENNKKIIDIAKYIEKKFDCSLIFSNHDNRQEIDELVKDRKIHNGIDERTYQVDFSKIHSSLPGYQTKFDVESGIDLLINQLEKLKLDINKFKQKDLYRLQYMEHLVETRQLNEQLYFEKVRGS